MSQQVISIEVEDKPGVLTRISSLFSRRGFGIVSLSVGHTHKKGISRFTIVTDGDEYKMEQVRKQCQKLIHIIKTNQLFEDTAVLREFTIIKLELTPENKKKLHHIIDFYGGRLLNSSADQLIVEFSGSEFKINTIFNDLKEIKIIESIRTGKVGMEL